MTEVRKRFCVDSLGVSVSTTRQAMGRAAAKDVADCMRKLLDTKGNIRMIFAAAPSQNEFLLYLREQPGLDWSRVIAFQMDEYIGLDATHPSSFQTYLQTHLFQHIPACVFHRVETLVHPDDECERYGRLVRAGEIDIVCLGIGENGHIAFNDPGVADFDDPLPMKPVELDPLCRIQQVHDGCFETLDAVPTQAVTLTIPSLMAGKHLFCVVPGPTKRMAVQKCLTEEITEGCPASVLRRHRHCTLYVDADSWGANGGD